MKRKTKKFRLIVERAAFNRDALEREHIRSAVVDWLRGKSGIYALYRKSNLYYVGLASERRLKQRLDAHLKRDRHADKWDYIQVFISRNSVHLRELEALVLHAADPRGNRQRGKLGINQTRSIKNQARALMKEELDYSFEGSGYRTAQSSRKDKAKHSASLRVRGWYKGKTVKARLRKDFSLYWRGRVFNTPSAAANAVTKWRATNGLNFWHYKNSRGEWSPIKELRK